MHPAYSVIVFTTASGAGYGLLAWLALAGAAGAIRIEPVIGLMGFGLAFGLVTVGLLSSTAHLGRPERAWRALSQWRSSWLSREGVLALLTYLPGGLLGLQWVLPRIFGEPNSFLAVLAASCALLTLLSTGMIYATLRTIRQWHQPLTAPLYVALGLASGAILLNLILRLSSAAHAWSVGLALLMLLTGLVLKALYWRRIDEQPPAYTVESATGLGRLGKVRHLDPPHTQPNFVMREMGYRIARKHARDLRTIAVVLGFLVPAGGTALTLLPGTVAGIGGSAFAVLSMAIGLMV
jgi:DMSO reductase anchor subunit